MAASRTTFVGVVLAAVAALAGCGDEKTPASEESAQSSAAVTGGGIDACKLLSGDDIAKLLGSPIEGKPLGADPEMPACTWENRDTYESVTVEIGNPGTAVNGTLPPPEPGFPEVGTPGPDGMRFLASGMVEFLRAAARTPCRSRCCPLLGEVEENAAVDLARKIGPQLPQ